MLSHFYALGVSCHKKDVKYVVASPSISHVELIDLIWRYIHTYVQAQACPCAEPAAANMLFK